VVVVEIGAAAVGELRREPQRSCLTGGLTLLVRPVAFVLWSCSLASVILLYRSHLPTPWGSHGLLHQS